VFYRLRRKIRVFSSCKRINSVREAEMRNNKEKKFWREKVEIGLVHVQAFAREMGTTITIAEVAEFLNRAGVAQSLWIQMKQAGEQYIKSNLKSKITRSPDRPRAGQEIAMIQ
jgi:hypothetical protein